MKIVRTLSFALATTLLFGVSACNNENGGNKQDELTKDTKGTVRYAYWDTNQDPWINLTIEGFNKEYPNIDIVLEPTSWADYWTKLEAAATGGSIADVIWMNGPNVMKYAQGEIIKPLDDTVEKYPEIATDNYPAGLISMYTIDNNLWAIPKDFDSIGVWYNKKIFDDAGVEYPTDDWTWDDMVEKARALTKEDGSIYGIGAMHTNQAGFYNTVFGHGGYVISDDKKESGWDKPEAQAGIQCWVDIMEEGLSPRQASLEENDSTIQFAAGRLAMTWAGSWGLPVLTESDVKDDIDLVQVPSINGEKAVVIHGVGHALNAKTEVSNMAEAWLAFLSGKESAKISAETGAAIPSYTGMADSWKGNFPEYNLQTYLTAAAEYSHAYPVSANTSEWLQYETDTLNKIYALELDVKEGLNDLAVKMNEVLAGE